MPISGWLRHLVSRALTESMDVRTMTHLVRRLVKNYDLHKRTGFPTNIAIPNRDAAEQIVRDMCSWELILPFIKLLFDIRETGLMGRRYHVPYLREIATELKKCGYLFDKESKMFVENSSVRKTQNWGVLREDEEYIFTFLKIDMVDNTGFVRRNNPQIVKKVYSDIRSIFQTSVEKRNGRIWNWEGDGGIGAFYFGKKNNLAVLSGIEILHELFIYNLINYNSEPIRLRMVIHSGPCVYKHKYDEIRSETINFTNLIESKSNYENSVLISDTCFRMLHHQIAGLFNQINIDLIGKLYIYRI